MAEPYSYGAPPDPMRGDRLAAELGDAGYLSEGGAPAIVYISDGELWIGALASDGGFLTDVDRAAIQNIVNAHTGEPTAAEESQRSRHSRLAQLAALATLTAEEQAEAVRLLLDEFVAG